MNDNQYKYLFPFEKVRRKAKILIYGAGIVGQEYLKQIFLTEYCTVVGMVDKNYKQYKFLPVEVYDVSNIEKVEYDYIVLAFKTGMHVKHVENLLVMNGVLDEKIIYSPSRNYCDLYEKDNLSIVEDECSLALKKSKLSIAIKTGATLGDNVIRKKFIEELIKIAPKCKIDIYSLASESFLPSIYKDCNNINLLIPDGGSLYQKYNKQYTLALTLSYSILVDNFNFVKAAEQNEVFAKKMQKLEVFTKDYNKDIDVFATPFNLVIRRQIYMGNNCYSMFNCGDVFRIKNSKVYISTDFKTIKHSLPKKYITINYGAGITVESMKFVSKIWPGNYFEKFIKEFKKNYPDYKVIQLGSYGAYKLKNVDQYFLGEDFEVVKCILKKSLFHLDIDGGLVHLATQLDTKCIVLFGPTQVQFFGYKQNINILAGGCHGCYGLYGDINKCAKHLLKPTCMYSITPEIVMEATNAYFKTIY